MKHWDLGLAVVALLSVVVYSLACRPAWSPSGNAVVFTYSVDDEYSGVALYDRTTREVTGLLQSTDGDFVAAQSVWAPDGSAIYVLAPSETPEGDALAVLRVAPSGGAPGEIAAVDSVTSREVIMQPMLTDGRWLWISGVRAKEDSSETPVVIRVDLSDGAVTEHFKSPDMVLLYDLGTRGCWYLRHNESAGEDAAAQFDIGRFDPETASLERLYTVDADMSPYLAAEPDGARVAVVVDTAAGGKAVRILGGPEPRDVALPETVSDTGGLEWVGGAVWMGAGLEEGTGETREESLALLVVDVGTGAVKAFPLASDGVDSNSAVFLQPAVSPDRKTLAIMSPLPDDPDKVGLLLLDLANPDKGFTAVAPPPRTVPLDEAEGALPESPGAAAVESTSGAL